MTTFASLLLPAALAGAEVPVYTMAALSPTPIVAAATVPGLYPPDDPEGPDDAGNDEGAGSGGSASGSNGSDT